MPTQPESMKSDMAGNQMCRAKIINRAQPWSQTRISVTNKLGIHFSSSWKGGLFSTFGYREIRHCNNRWNVFSPAPTLGCQLFPSACLPGQISGDWTKWLLEKNHLIIGDWKGRKNNLIIVDWKEKKSPYNCLSPRCLGWNLQVELVSRCRRIS